MTSVNLRWVQSMLLIAAGCGPLACGSIPASQTGVDLVQAVLLQAWLNNVSHILSTTASEMGSTADDSGNSMALTDASSCATVTTTPASLDPNALPNAFAIEWEWMSCLVLVDTQQVGRQHSRVTRDGSGIVKIEAGLAISRFVARTSETLAINANNTITSSGTPDSGRMLRNVADSGLRSSSGGNKATNYTMEYINTLSIDDTFEPGNPVPQERVVSGQGNVHLDLSGLADDLSYNQLVFAPGCCYPSAGSLQRDAKEIDGSVTTTIFNFSPPCGAVKQGRAAGWTLPTCR